MASVVSFLMWVSTIGVGGCVPKGLQSYPFGGGLFGSLGARTALLLRIEVRLLRPFGSNDKTVETV